MLQRHAGLYSIDGVALSHLHADHCLDMCSYWVARRYAPGGPQPAIPVHAPAGAAERLSRAADPGADLTSAFTFHALAPETWRIGPFEVTTVRMNHPVETYGFRFEHRGRVLAYSADTGPTDALVDLARDADLLLCEATFTEEPDLPPDLHLTGRQAGEHAARARARHLVLTHISPGTDKQTTLAEAEAVFPDRISLAASGQQFDLAPTGARPL